MYTITRVIDLQRKITLSSLSWSKKPHVDLIFAKNKKENS